MTGHLSNKNPQLADFESKKGVLAIFNDSNAYISPTFYTKRNVVPTWNYVAVHIYGNVSTFSNESSIKSHLVEMHQYFENMEGQDSSYNFSDDLLSYITCFKIEITKIEAQFKLSQNKSNEDKKLIASNLRSQGDGDSVRIAELIEESF